MPDWFLPSLFDTQRSFYYALIGLTVIGVATTRAISSASINVSGVNLLSILGVILIVPVWTSPVFGNVIGPVKNSLTTVILIGFAVWLGNASIIWLLKRQEREIALWREQLSRWSRVIISFCFFGIFVLYLVDLRLYNWNGPDDVASRVLFEAVDDVANGRSHQLQANPDETDDALTVWEAAQLPQGCVGSDYTIERVTYAPRKRTFKSETFEASTWKNSNARAVALVGARDCWVLVAGQAAFVAGSPAVLTGLTVIGSFSSKRDAMTKTKRFERRRFSSQVEAEMYF